MSRVQIPDGPALQYCNYIYASEVLLKGYRNVAFKKNYHTYEQTLKFQSSANHH